ncbi:MAG: DUF222 domain-containing protein [Egibacteraceae bacterium]
MYETVVLGECQAARGAVDALAPPLDTLAAVAWDDLDGDTLSRCVIDLTRHRDRLDGLCTLAIAAHDRAQAWKADGCRSEKEWLATRCRTSIGEAAGRAETARRLGQLPATAQALANGTIRPRTREWPPRPCVACPTRRSRVWTSWSPSRAPTPTPGSCGKRSTTTPTAWRPRVCNRGRSGRGRPAG